jgi:hypothetical protein
MSIKSVVAGLAVVSLAAFMVLSCGGKAAQAGNGGGGGGGAVVNTAAAGGQSNDAEEEWVEPPCTVHDDDDWFAATGFAAGPRTRRDVISTNALRNGQRKIRNKMKHAYQGMVSDYDKYLGNNQGTDADVDVTSAGDAIIDAIVNDTREVCGPKFTKPDSKGQMECVVALKIRKKEIAEKIADKVENMVSKDERLRIQFEEFDFRKKMQEKFKEFKQEQALKEELD